MRFYIGFGRLFTPVSQLMLM